MADTTEQRAPTDDEYRDVGAEVERALDAYETATFDHGCWVMGEGYRRASDDGRQRQRAKVIAARHAVTIAIAARVRGAQEKAR